MFRSRIYTYIDSGLVGMQPSLHGVGGDHDGLVRETLRVDRSFPQQFWNRWGCNTGISSVLRDLLNGY